MKTHRLIFVFLLVTLLWTILLVRGAYLQLFPHPRLAKIKKKQFNRLIQLSPRRGDILDRNGKELAVSISAYSLFADPKIISDPYQVSRKLSRYFAIPFQSVHQKLKNQSRRFVWIQRRLEKKDYLKIKKWNIRGLGFKEEFKRIYPNNNLASHLLGFVGQDQQGLGGLEKQLDSLLQGNSKKIHVQRDARGRVFVEDGRVFTQSLEGADVYLTIDKNLQYWVEKELEYTVQKHKAQGAWAIVLNPENSEILALAAYPDFNPNRALEAPMEIRRNKPVQDVYELGSVMKTFSIGGALQKKIVSPNTKVDTEGGVFQIGSLKIKEADRKHHFDQLSVSEILSHSSNVGTAKIALRLKDKNLYQTLTDFGFGQKLGVDLPGEAKGLLTAPPWKDHLTANISFGHGLAATALQVANAYGAIANGGKLHRPFVVKKYQDSLGKFIPTPKKLIRKVLDTQSTQLLKIMLSNATTQGGSGHPARINGFPVAGKTGTAQKADPLGRGYLPGHYLANFAGFVPANQPRYVIYVAVDQPQKNGYYASLVAAPLFQRIALFALSQKGSSPVYVGKNKVIHQKKPAPEKLETPKKKYISLSNTKNSHLTPLKIMPDLKGMTYLEVLKVLNQKNIELIIQGRGRVAHTQPPVGKRIFKKQKIRVKLTSDSYGDQ